MSQDGARIRVGAAAADASDVGGKGGNLGRMLAAGFPVPPFLVVTTAVFAEVAARARDPIAAALAGWDGQDPDSQDRAGAEAASAAIASALREAGLAPEDRAALESALAAAFPPEAWVAVRSSALGEDSEQDSFAGQLDTFLHVPLAEVPQKVLDCFASAWSPRALLYRRTRGLDGGEVAAAAVVQRMVEAEAAGVLFTADPTRGERGRMVVSAGLGLGEGVVADLVETDSLFVELASGRVLEQVVREKRERVAFDREAGRGTRVEPVPAERAVAPALSAPQVEALAALGRRLEERFEKPQDVEWALDGAGELFLLQTRPITTWLPEPGRRERIYDNSNVVEGYPTVTTPLTFSFVRAAYEVIFRQSALAFGVPARVVARERGLFSHMVALVDGRVYYDLLNWYRLYGLVPGFEERVRAWEAALGLEARELPPPPGLREKLRALPATLRGLRRVLWNFWTLPREVRAFELRFRRAQERFARTDLLTLDAEELLEVYERLVRDLLERWEVTTVNDFYAFQLYELLGKLLDRYGFPQGAALRNDLLCGETGMESVEPVRSLVSLAHEARQTPALQALFAEEPDDARVWERLSSDPSFGVYHGQLQVHVERYGDRTTGELMLETPSLRDEPARLVAMLRGHLATEQTVEAMEERERAIRRAAEERLSKGLAGHPLRAAFVRFVLRHTRATVKYRENLRLARTRAFGMVKRIFRQLGVLLAEQRLLGAPEDVLYLGVDELIGVVRGCGLSRDLRAVVALRRAEFEAFREREPPGRVRARGIAYARPFPRAEAAAPPEGALAGIGASPGRVRARARVVLDPREVANVSGEILVARMTDPGWVFLMVTAAGMIVERGSLLSHTAIIGRELGIPTVVGVTGVTQRIETGQLVEIDGEAGTVVVVEEDPPQG
ncbi:MAG: PEP/pyruvate-binding domain-containing protein [Planctomycetota bacterium]